jgi:hypothetical protein
MLKYTREADTLLRVANNPIASDMFSIIERNLNQMSQVPEM